LRRSRRRRAPPRGAGRGRGMPPCPCPYRAAASNQARCPWKAATAAARALRQGMQLRPRTWSCARAPARARARRRAGMRPRRKPWPKELELCFGRASARALGPHVLSFARPDALCVRTYVCMGGRALRQRARAQGRAGECNRRQTCATALRRRSRLRGRRARLPEHGVPAHSRRPQRAQQLRHPDVPGVLLVGQRAVVAGGGSMDAHRVTAAGPSAGARAERGVGRCRGDALLARRLRSAVRGGAGNRCARARPWRGRSTRIAAVGLNVSRAGAGTRSSVREAADCSTGEQVAVKVIFGVRILPRSAGRRAAHSARVTF
jgi:hypothetical protein